MKDFFASFLDDLAERGLRVTGPKEGEPDDRLHLHGPAVERTPAIMTGLTIHKRRLVEMFGRKRPPEEPTQGGEPGPR
jgi:hypothetical protein